VASNPQPNPGIDLEFADRYERERNRWARRRFLWLCGLGAGLLLFSPAGNISSMASNDTLEASQRDGTLIDLIGDCVMILLFSVGFLLGLRRTLSRRDAIRLTSGIVVAICLLQIIVAPASNFLDMGSSPGNIPPNRFWFIIGVLALLAVLILHFFSSLFVAMTAREAALPLVPILLFFWLVTLTLNEGSIRVKLALILLSPVAGLPGFLWSLWCYKRFDERFRVRMITSRYGELKDELADARRFHEALFPPPISRGSIKVTYSYEPMREIGGDFLFAHPLSFPPAVSGVAQSIVLIDVTGHGVQAALAVNRLHGELERLFSHNPRTGPLEVVKALNRFTLVSLAPRAVFATALCLRVARDSQSVEWASAGHPPAIILRPSGDISRLNPTAMMLGVLDDDAFDAEARTESLAPGDVLIAYTDGAIEAINEAGKPVGLEGFIQIAHAAASARPSEPGSIAAGLMAHLDRFRAGPPTDDTLIVEIRRDA